MGAAHSARCLSERLAHSAPAGLAHPVAAGGVVAAGEDEVARVAAEGARRRAENRLNVAGR